MEKKPLRYTLFIITGTLLLGILLLFSVNCYVVTSSKDRMVDLEDAATIRDADCILVLGCSVKKDGSPSDMLADRLTTGIELYNAKCAPKLLMSGDHGQDGYNEVGAMKHFAIQKGIPSSDVFMDHAGFSTYESLYRAKEIFGVQKLVIVTQEYHLYRALYIAKSMGIEAYGVSANLNPYSGQTARDLREILARAKDFGTSLFKPNPTYLGEPISLQGNGDITNDVIK